ncbi:unnamed protein product [Linum trigynum]|uniref:Uncharacterized protein n=1 Tax=Linum trigynum TaxID=586398 RepID=A0AAV2DEQ4_9ROSI
MKWLSLIWQALNGTKSDEELSQHYVAAVEHKCRNLPRPRVGQMMKQRLSLSDLISIKDELGREDFQRFKAPNSNMGSEAPSSPRSNLSGASDDGDKNPAKPRYRLMVSKQMVGGLSFCVG